MTEYKFRNKSGQLCGMLYRAQNRDLFYVILDTNNKQLNYVKIHSFDQNATKEVEPDFDPKLNKARALNLLTLLAMAMGSSEYTTWVCLFEAI